MSVIITKYVYSKIFSNNNLSPFNFIEAASIRRVQTFFFIIVEKEASRWVICDMWRYTEN